VAAGGTAAAGGLSVLSLVLGFLATGMARVVAWGVRLSRWLFNPMGAGMTSRYALTVARLAAAFGSLRAAIAGVGALVAAGGPLAALGAVLATVAGSALAGYALARLLGFAGGTRAASGASGSPASRPAETTPDQFDKPMGGPVGLGELGANRGTFFAALASQMAAGPQASAAERTADATERTADAVEEIMAVAAPPAAAAAPGRAATNSLLGMVVPGATVMQKALRSLSGGLGVGQNAPGRDLVDTSEETLLATKTTNRLLQQLVDAALSGGIVFG
jgi:hypothetical protein